MAENTIIEFKSGPHQNIEIIDSEKGEYKLFNEESVSKMHELRVGGLKEQLNEIERRVFGSRQLNPMIMRKMGIKHCKGILLYGPPGTGKTLIAREISKLFEVKPKVVNGPSILGSLVGESEQRIRDLFDDAVKAQE